MGCAASARPAPAAPFGSVRQGPTHPAAPQPDPSAGALPVSAAKYARRPSLSTAHDSNISHSLEGVPPDEMLALVELIRADGPAPFAEVLRRASGEHGTLSAACVREALQAYLGQPAHSAVVSMLVAMLLTKGRENELPLTLQLWRSWCKTVAKPVRALLIIDVQNDFIDGTLALKHCPAGQDAAETVPVINELRASTPFDFVAVSKDWHPPQHCSFHETVKEGKSPAPVHPSQDDSVALTASLFDIVVLTAPDGSAMPQTMWPRHCVQDTWGAACHEDLVMEESDFIVDKGTDPRVDSYSAFFDNSKFKQTSLLPELEARGVTHVYCCGVALDVCVAYTAVHSAEQGFITYVVEDACRGVTTEGIAQKKHLFQRIGIHVIQAADVPASFGKDDVAAAASAAKNVALARLAAQLMMHNEGHQASDVPVDSPQANAMELLTSVDELSEEEQLDPELVRAKVDVLIKLGEMRWKFRAVDSKQSPCDEALKALADAEYLLSEHLRLVASAQPALSQEELLLPWAAARANIYMGQALSRIFHGAGEAELCEELLLKALSLRQELGGKESVGETFFALAKLKQARKQYHEAESFFEQSLSLMGEARDGSQALELTYGQTCVSLATLYMMMSEQDEASPKPTPELPEECYANALHFYTLARDTFAAAVHDHPKTAWAYEGIALAHRLRGEMEAANAAAEEAGRIRHMLQNSAAGKQLFAQELQLDRGLMEEITSAKCISSRWHRSLNRIKAAASLRKSISMGVRKGPLVPLDNPPVASGRADETCSSMEKEYLEAFPE